MWIKLIWLLLLSVSSGILNRMGGAERYNKNWRDAGVSLIVTLYMFTSGICSLWWALLLNFGLLFGALTSYHYFLPKPKDYKWQHYTMHGFFIGLSALPTAFCAQAWLGLMLRTIALSMIMGIWYFIAKKHDVAHEFGRGFFIAITLPLLLA